MPNGTVLLVVLLGLLAALAAIATIWSVAWDLKAYRAWKREQIEPQPRWKRRQRKKAATEENQDVRRWRWHILALQCSAFGLVAGSAGVATGYLTQTAWLMVTGGNLVFLGILAWAAYNLVLPKPRVLREKTLPRWLRRKSR